MASTLTLAQLKTLLINFTGLGNTDDDTDLTRIINISACDVWLADEWAERIGLPVFVATVAPYTTGTVTVANGSPTVTGSGTTFPSHTANTRLFSLGYGQPSYLVASRDSATQLTLARNYDGENASAQTYTLYSDIYDLASTVDKIKAVRLHHQRPNGSLPYLGQSTLDQWDYLPTITGYPRLWCPMPHQTAGTPRIRVWPIPDAVYTLSAATLKAYTEMSSAGDFCVVNDNKRQCIIWKALEYLYMLTDRAADSESAAKRYQVYLAEARARQRPVSPAPTVFRPFDQPARGGVDGLWAALPVPE